jgi:hypothetical protein
MVLAHLSKDIDKMATPTRPCPHCGAAVLATARHCTSCGKPATVAAPEPSPQKTIFGYQAPVSRPNSSSGGYQNPPAPAQPPAPAAQQPPPSHLQPPKPFGNQPPSPSYPPPGYGQSPPPGYGQSPPHGYGQAPPHGYGQAPPGYAQPPQPGYPQSPPPSGWGQPPQPGYAQQPPQPGYPQQPAQAGWGQHPPGYAPPAPGYQQGPAYGQPQQPIPTRPFVEGDPIGRFAASLPTSAPGTLFGLPLSLLRDAGFEKKMLYVCAIALGVATFLPLSFEPLLFGFSGAITFENLFLPLLVAACYFIPVAAPKELQQKIPPTVMRWLPFGAAVVYLGVAGGVSGNLALAAAGAMQFGYPLLVFGLLTRLTDPNDPYPRYIIAVGSGLCFIALLANIDAIKYFLSFGTVLGGIFGVLTFVVMLIAAASFVFVLPPERFPALRSVSAFVPLVTAILLAWPFFAPLYLMVTGLVQGAPLVVTILTGARGLAFILGTFGVLLVTSPRAYDEIKRFIGRDGSNFSGPGGWNDSRTNPEWQNDPPTDPQVHPGPAGWGHHHPGGGGSGWPPNRG